MLRLAVQVLLFVSSAVADENWPVHRGPSDNGHSQSTGLPLTWSETENVVWKTAIHDKGWSSPVVWGKQVWVTTGREDGKELFAVCVDRASGKVVHDIKVFDVAEPEHVADVNSYASPTPVIEAGRVYVHFGTYGTACLDTTNGKTLWTRRDLNCDHHDGLGSLPILFENLLIVHVDGRDVQYVVALDKQTGQTVWKTARSIDYGRFPPNLRKAFCMPIVIEHGGRRQLIGPAAKGIFGYDARTGQELWKIRHNGWSMTPRPVFGHGLVFFVNDYERPELWAIRPGDPPAAGKEPVELGEDHIAWKIKQGSPKQPAFLLIGEHLYFVNDEGVAFCVEAETGRVVWRERMGGSYSASPVFADGKMYFFNRQAAATVLEPGPAFKPLAVNRLEGEMMASPAIAGRALFVRTRTHLYRIEKK